MPSFQDLDVAAFVTEAPEFSYRDGMFHIRQRYSEHCVIERVMRPSLFFLSIRKAVDCARAHKFGGAEIIDFPMRGEDDPPALHG